MCRFIESIRLENGSIKLLDYHQDRVNKTGVHYFEKNNTINLLNSSYKCNLLFLQI